VIGGSAKPARRVGQLDDSPIDFQAASLQAAGVGSAPMDTILEA
jgi:hypothetical protein